MSDNDWTKPPSEDDIKSRGYKLGEASAEGFVPEGTSIDDVLGRILAGQGMGMLPIDPGVHIFDGIHPITDAIIEFTNAAPPFTPASVGGVMGLQLGIKLALARPDVARVFIEAAEIAGDGHNPINEIFHACMEDGESRMRDDDDGPQVNWN